VVRGVRFFRAGIVLKHDVTLGYFADVYLADKLHSHRCFQTIPATKYCIFTAWCHANDDGVELRKQLTDRQTGWLGRQARRLLVMWHGLCRI